MQEMWGILFSFLYVIAILLIATVMEAKEWLSPYVARKFVHFLVGSWILPTFFLFDHWYMAIIPPFCFIWANLYLERKRLFSFEMREGYGTVYFPISFLLLLIFFWDPSLRVYAVLGGLIMAWGDPMAALIGRRWGKHRYPRGQIYKSFEGSAAMAVTAFVACFVSFAVFQPSALWNTVAWSLLLAGLATLIEAFSGRGLDNLTVPLGTAWIGYLLFVNLP